MENHGMTNSVCGYIGTYIVLSGTKFRGTMFRVDSG